MINTPSRKFPKSLPGPFWGITTFFNPVGYNNKLSNYRSFRNKSKNQGLKLLAVELAFGDNPFQLTREDAEILIQRRGNEKNIMWQKEALLNIAIKHLPADCDKVAWIDCDVLFKNDDWIQETSKLLEEYLVVQPYSFVVYLPQGTPDMDKKTFEKLKAIPYGFHQGQKSFSYAHRFLTSGHLSGNTGFAWAIRKEILQKYAFYDKLILGSSDFVMARLFSGLPQKNIHRFLLNDRISNHYLQWAETLHHDTHGSMWFTPGTILHLWHGNLSNRFYLFRNDILEKFDYDPQTDVHKTPDGLLEWTSAKPELRQAVKEYFHLRNEEGKNILTSLMVDEIYRNDHQIKQIKSLRSYKILDTLFNLFKCH